MHLFVKQDVFDTVLNHIRKQGPAVTAHGTCAYRTEEGKSCAIGCLIPDDLYTEAMEGASGWALTTSINDRDFAYDKADAALVSAMKKVYPGMTLDDALLLARLQNIHDSAVISTAGFNGVEFEDRMRELARDKGLIYTPPKQ
jgi:hypothetical protein